MKFSKILYRIGFAACILLFASCFLPWAYYADPHIGSETERTFTGFFTYQNQYGKPGKFLGIIAVVMFVFMLVPKIWAKRANLFIAALGVGYAIKSYILFTSCYNAYCPDKKLGIFIMMISMFLLLVTSAFPDIKLNADTKETGKDIETPAV